MRTTLFLILMFISLNTVANSFMSEPSCFAPNKPLIFSPNSYIERYNLDVIEYKSCIYRFIKEQEQAIILHEKSIENAKELLNSQLK